MRVYLGVEKDRRPRTFEVVTLQMWQFCTKAYSLENTKHTQIISNIGTHVTCRSIHRKFFFCFFHFTDSGSGIFSK